MKPKKIVYIICFIITGIMLSTVIHGLIEITVIYILVSDFKKYNLGLNWQQWEVVHSIGTVVLFVGGVILGAFLGFKYWKKIYESKK